MSFTQNELGFPPPTIRQVADQMVRIQPLFLASGASGTIGLHGDSGADIQLPAGFQPREYQAFGNVVGLADSIEVEWCQENDDVSDNIAIPIIVAKGGSPFRITLTNAASGEGTDSNGLEVYVHFHD